MSWTDPDWPDQPIVTPTTAKAPPKMHMTLSEAREFADKLINTPEASPHGAAAFRALLDALHLHELMEGTIADKNKELAALLADIEAQETKLAEATMALTNVEVLKVNAEKADKKIKAFTKPFLGKHGGDWLLFGYPVTELSRDSLQRLVIYAFQNKVGFNQLYNVPDDTQHAIPDVEPFKSQPGAHIAKEPPF